MTLFFIFFNKKAAKQLIQIILQKYMVSIFNPTQSDLFFLSIETIDAICMTVT